MEGLRPFFHICFVSPAVNKSTACWGRTDRTCLENCCRQQTAQATSEVARYVTSITDHHMLVNVVAALLEKSIGIDKIRAAAPQFVPVTIQNEIVSGVGGYK